MTPATRCYLCQEPRYIWQLTCTTIGHAVGIHVCGDCMRCERTVKPL